MSSPKRFNSKRFSCFIVISLSPDTKFSPKTIPAEFEKHKPVMYLSAMTPNYIVSRGLNSTQSSLTITVISCWIEVWFKNDPPAHHEDRNLILSSLASNHSRLYCFCDSQRTQASSFCNFFSPSSPTPPRVSAPSPLCIFVLFKSVLMETCNCTFGGYHNKSALVREEQCN